MGSEATNQIDIFTMGIKMKITYIRHVYFKLYIRISLFLANLCVTRLGGVVCVSKTCKSVVTIVVNAMGSTESIMEHNGANFFIKTVRPVVKRRKQTCSLDRSPKEGHVFFV